MELNKCILERRSIRKYLDVPLDISKVTDLIDAAMHSPSAGNLQTWRFIIVVDSDIRQKIAGCCLDQEWIAKAPVHLVICSDLSKTKEFYGLRGERFYAIQDCAAAAMTILLKAYEMGLGSCWVGAFDEESLKRILNIPLTSRPQVVLTLGYADEKPKPSTMYNIKDITYFNSYGGKIKDFDAVLELHSRKIEKLLKSGSDLIKKIGKKVKK
jgi:nitroreductase